MMFRICLTNFIISKINFYSSKILINLKIDTTIKHYNNKNRLQTYILYLSQTIDYYV